MEQDKNFSETLKEIEKQFGKGTIKTFDETIETEVISTGSLQLDRALGVGGLPRGRIIELYGNESSGKTTVALQLVHQCQKNGGVCAYIDLENALDTKYCENNKVNAESLILAQPSSGEQAFSIIEALIKTGKIDLIIVDSVAAMVPEAEINSEFENQTIGLHARLMSKGLRVIQSYASKHNVCVVFINQIREKIGIMFGDTKTTTGGWALKFFSSVRIELKRIELIKNGADCVGIKSQARIIKNKMAPPLKTAFVNIYFDCGFDYDNEIIDIAIEKGIISKKGSWYFYNDQKISQGKTGMVLFLKNKENLNIFDDVKKRVLDASCDAENIEK